MLLFFKRKVVCICIVYAVSSCFSVWLTHDTCLNQHTDVIIDYLYTQVHVIKQSTNKMATMLAIPLKKTYEVDLIKPLRNFIQSTFTQADPEYYNHALQEFNKLRNLMITKSVDKHESALEVLCRWVQAIYGVTLFRTETRMSSLNEAIGKTSCDNFMAGKQWMKVVIFIQEPLLLLLLVFLLGRTMVKLGRKYGTSSADPETHQFFLKF